MDRAIEEINFGKANGACGVFMRGFEGELLSDSSLFPVYEEAQRLDLPICIHAGTEILVTTISLARMSFHASSCRRWARSIT